jgi:hypothetical protein
MKKKHRLKLNKKMSAFYTAFPYLYYIPLAFKSLPIDI